MKIAFITNIPTPYRTAFFDEVQRQTQLHGHQLIVLYCAETEPRRTWPYEPEKMVHDHAVMDGYHFRAVGVYTHLNPSVIVRLRSYSPDCVVTCGAWNTPTMLLALAWCRLRGCNVYFWSEGHEKAVLNSSGLIAWSRRKVYGLYHGFLTPNEASDSWALRQGGSGKKLVRLVNAVNVRSFIRPDGLCRASLRRELGIPTEKRVFIQVGRLDPVKGTMELLSAFLGVTEEKRRNSLLILVGTGPLESEIRRIASGHSSCIMLAGDVAAESVARWLWAADIFVLNTMRDPNPLSPIEASAASLPLVVSSRAGNVNDLVDEGVTGWVIVSPDDPKSVLEEVMRISDEALEEMGKNARSRVERRFNVVDVAGDLLRDLARS